MWRLEQVQRKIAYLSVVCITGKVACNIYKSAFIKQASLWSESRFSSAFISGVSLLSPVETKGRGVQVSQPVMLFDTIPIITTTLRPAEANSPCSSLTPALPTSSSEDVLKHLESS